MAVEDGLGRLEGVHNIHIDLQSNQVELRCGPDVAMDLASVPVAIREAGFVPADLSIVASGAFEDGGTLFRPDGWSRALAVASGGSDTSDSVRIAARVTGWEDGGAVTLVPTSISAL